MESPHRQASPATTVSASSTLPPSGHDEIDRTLIRELRSLTPEQRLEWHMRMVRLVLEMRDGLRR